MTLPLHTPPVQAPQNLAYSVLLSSSAGEEDALHVLSASVDGGAV